MGKGPVSGANAALAQHMVMAWPLFMMWFGRYGVASSIRQARCIAIGTRPMVVRSLVIRRATFAPRSLRHDPYVAPPLVNDVRRTRRADGPSDLQGWRLFCHWLGCLFHHGVCVALRGMLGHGHRRICHRRLARGGGMRVGIGGIAFGYQFRAGILRGGLRKTGQSEN